MDSVEAIIDSKLEALRKELADKEKTRRGAEVLHDGVPFPGGKRLDFEMIAAKKRNLSAPERK